MVWRPSGTTSSVMHSIRRPPPRKAMIPRSYSVGSAIIRCGCPIGALKGARGVLMDRMRNSVDRSLLLASLLTLGDIASEGRVEHWSRSNSPRSSGSIGGTRAVCWSRSAMCRRPSTRHRIISTQKQWPSRNSPSGKPGAVQLIESQKSKV